MKSKMGVIRKIKIVLMVTLVLNLKASAQNFILSNALYAEGSAKEYVTFNLTVSENYLFSSDEMTNSYGILTISLGKIKPSVNVPQGNGAELFNWKLVSSGKSGKEVFSWVGTTKNVTMLHKNTYTIMIPLTKLVGNAAGRLSKEDVIMLAQFTDPANAPTGNEADNMVVIRKGNSGSKYNDR